MVTNNQRHTHAPATVRLLFAQEDERLARALEEHLMCLARDGLVRWTMKAPLGCAPDLETWRDGQSADVVLVLVSSDFLRSPDHTLCLDRIVELRRCAVLPVVLRPLDLPRAWLARLGTSPVVHPPVLVWGSEDAALPEVASTLRGLLVPGEGRPPPIARTTPWREGSSLPPNSPAHEKEAPLVGALRWVAMGTVVAGVGVALYFSWRSSTEALSHRMAEDAQTVEHTLSSMIAAPQKRDIAGDVEGSATGGEEVKKCMPGTTRMEFHERSAFLCGGPSKRAYVNAGRLWWTVKARSGDSPLDPRACYCLLQRR